MKKILISLAIASTFAVDARASDITFHPDSNAITIDGKMIFGDEKKFLQFALPLEPGAVVIFRNNPGGNLRAGIEIGKIIRMKGFNTFAPNECSSACALAWTAGVNRVMTSSSRVGFHAAYEIKSDGTTLPVGQGNAIIGAYLNSLGFSEAAIRFATYQNANGLEFLTKDMADKLGIIVSIDNVQTEGTVTKLNKVNSDNNRITLSCISRRYGALDVAQNRPPLCEASHFIITGEHLSEYKYGAQPWSRFKSLPVNVKLENYKFYGFDESRGILLKIQESSKKGDYDVLWSWANADKSAKGWNKILGTFIDFEHPVLKEN